MTRTERNILIAVIAIIILWLLKQKKAQTSVSATVNGNPVTPDQQAGIITGPNSDSPDANNAPLGGKSNQFNNGGFSVPIVNTPNPPPPIEEPLPGPALTGGPLHTSQYDELEF